MRIRITHQTRYVYDEPVRNLLQVLRMTPRDHEGQHILSWRIEPSVEGLLRVGEDSYGNVYHTFSTDERVREFTLFVSGEVETHDAAGVVRNAVERLPGDVFLRDTDLTAADEAIRAFAQASAGRTSTLDILHDLLTRLNAEMAFEIATTDSNTTAREAFAAGRGVCQDLTHVFIAAARHLGIPARYVSGYFFRADGVTDQDAGHAWVEAMVPGLGWTGFDPANCISPADAHVRVAVGLDYLAAAPVRGSRRGGGHETLDVRLTVSPAQRQVQG